MTSFSACFRLVVTVFTTVWFQKLTYIWWFSLWLEREEEEIVWLHTWIYSLCAGWCSTREVIGEQGWAGLLLGVYQWGILHAGERLIQIKDLGKTYQEVLWLKGWPSLLFMVKQELRGGSCPPMSLTVNRARLEESLLFFLPATGSVVLQMLFKLNNHMTNTLFPMISLDIV